MQKKVSLIALFLALTGCSDAEKAPAPAPMAAAPQASPESLQSWAAKAKFDELSGNYAGAVNDYQNIIQASPASMEPRLAQAEAYRRLGNYDQAFSIYAALLKADPNNLAAKEGGALTLISKGDYDTSVTLLDEVIKADPRRPGALNGMGVLFTTRNLQGDAQQYFNEALKFSPNNPTVLGNLGLSQALEGKYAAADSSLSAASANTTLGSYDRKRADMNAALVHAAGGHPEDALAIAGAYYGGSEYNNAFGLYAKLASDKKMSATYLHSALTDGRTYYEQRWDTIAAKPVR